jgi:hypothetical protein
MWWSIADFPVGEVGVEVKLAFWWARFEFTLQLAQPDINARRNDPLSRQSKSDLNSSSRRVSFAFSHLISSHPISRSWMAILGKLEGNWASEIMRGLGSLARREPVHDSTQACGNEEEARCVARSNGSRRTGVGKAKSWSLFRFLREDGIL